MLAAVFTSLQGIWTNQVLTGGSLCADSNKCSSLSKSGTSGEVASVCEHEGWFGDEHTL